jgi:hypothetical protein
MATVIYWMYLYNIILIPRNFAGAELAVVKLLAEMCFVVSASGSQPLVSLTSIQSRPIIEALGRKNSSESFITQSINVLLCIQKRSVV